MGEHVSSRRGVAGGLACVAVGAAALLGGLATPAGATGGPWGDHGDDLGDRFGGGQDWDQAEVPMTSGRHVLDDGGTRDGADDVIVDMNVHGGQVDWTSNVEIDAVSFGGHDRDDVDVFAPTGGHRGKHDGHGAAPPSRGGGHHGRRMTFCWDKDRPPEHPTPQPPSPPHESTTTTVAPPEEETTTTTAPPEETTTTTAAPAETTTTTAPATTVTSVAPTTPTTGAPTTTAPAGGTLPETGSNSTFPLALAGVALLGVGAGLVVVTRRMRASS